MNNAASGVDFRIVENLLEYPNGTNSKSKIDMGYDSNSVIKNNQITVGAGVDETDYTYGIRVGGYTVKKGSNGLAKGEYKVNGFTIEDNTITGKARMGISVMNCDKATVKNNNVSRLTGYQSYGIYISNSSGIEILDNIFEYVNHTLIYLTNNSTAENIVSNTLLGGNLGISNGKKSNINNLESNKIIGAGKIAIGVYSGSTIAAAKDNIIASAIGSAKKKSVFIAADCKAALFGHGSITMGVGEKYSVKAYVRKGKKATPKTSKKKVVAASKLVLTAKKKGKSTITLKESKNKSTIAVEVKAKPTSVTVPTEKVELAVGDVFLLEPEVNEGAGCAGYTYKSNNKGVVSVTDQGVLVAKGKGSAVITVKTYNKKKTTVEVVVQ
jgi:parallel beta-helix repeat protein